MRRGIHMDRNKGKGMVLLPSMLFKMAIEKSPSYGREKFIYMQKLRNGVFSFQKSWRKTVLFQIVFSRLAKEKREKKDVSSLRKIVFVERYSMFKGMLLSR